jgi:hypothetical protein
MSLGTYTRNIELNEMQSDIKIPQVLALQQVLQLPAHEREQYIREIIRKTLKMNPDGVTIPRLSKLLPFGDRTISKHLAIMLYTNEAYSEKIGTTLFYYPNGRLMRPASEKVFQTDRSSYQAFVVMNKRLGDSIFLQQRKVDEDSNDVGGGIMIPIGSFKEFAKFLSEIAEQV